MDTLLRLPLIWMSLGASLAMVAALIGPHGGPPPGASGVMTPAAELTQLLARADQAHRKATPYGSRALQRIMPRNPSR